MTEISDSAIPLLRADPRRFKQILVNLLSNAVKFTETGGTVTIRAGVGIAVENIRKTLAPFQQIDSALSRRHEGIGLGLPLTKSLVALHGGTLDLQSQAGKGTIVTVRLPAGRRIDRDYVAVSA